jgi:hypothetical protein
MKGILYVKRNIKVDNSNIKGLVWLLL